MLTTIALLIVCPALVALIVPKKILGLFALSILFAAPVLTVLTWQHFAAQPDGYGGHGLAAVLFSGFVMVGSGVSFTVAVIRYAINRDKSYADDAKPNEDMS